MNRTIALAAIAILLAASSAAAQGPRFAAADDTEVAMRGRHGAAAVQTQAARSGRGAPTAVATRKMHGAAAATRPMHAAAAADRPMRGAAADRPMRGANVDSGLSAELAGVVAGALGLSQEELHDLKSDGASIADIAAERGLDLATIEIAYLEARAAVIDRLLAEGTIHEFQAEQMRARGAEAFANLSTREGQAEGQNVTGERLYANRPTSEQPQALGPAVGRRGRW
jgi:hypothetical protein